LDEVAASSAQTGAIVTATEFEEVARRSGHDACPRDAVRLAAESRLPSGPATPAWRLGALAASALRKQEGLGSSVIVDDRLAAMAGTRREVLAEPDQSTSKLSFALDANALASRIVIGSRWRTSRRFNLARLIGDRLIHPEGGLHPATRAYTYRQKMQRSFAAELLCPFEALDDMLSGDYSSEAQEEAAEHFEVSELTVRTLLVNHKRIERAELDGEFDAEAA
jgi:hypothetical protein